MQTHDVEMLAALRRALFVLESSAMPPCVNAAGAVDAVRNAIASGQAAVGRTAEAPATFALVRHGAGWGRACYTIARLIELEGVRYGVPVPGARHAWPEQFRSKAKARAFAKTLGAVAPDLMVENHLPAVIQALMTEAEWEARKQASIARDRQGATSRLLLQPAD